jgi:transposase
VEQIAHEAGIMIKYLPPYCPELNPIELCFLALKYKLFCSRILNESDDPEWDIRETVDSVITPNLCYKNFRHCGYSVPPQI